MPTTFERYVAAVLTPKAQKHEKPSVLLVTCMDYRYAHRIVDVMDRWGLRGKYDMFVIAGAAAGSNQMDAWRESLVSHIRTARCIGHPLDRIVVLEHRDCGAYRHFFKLQWECVKPPDEEAKHKEQVELFVADMKKEFAKEIPDLVIDALLLAREEDDELHIETTPSTADGRE
jgi:carbonic anhydrase